MNTIINRGAASAIEIKAGSRNNINIRISMYAIVEYMIIR